MALKDDIKSYGLARSLAARVARRLQRHLGLHLWLVHTRPLQAEFELPAEHAVRFTFKRLTLNDALAASTDEANGMTPEFVRDAFARGDVCVGTFEQGKLVASGWRTTSRAPVTKALWLSLHGERMRYGYKALVMPPYRGMRLGTSNARHSDHYFVSKGITTAIAYVDLHNLPSMKSALRDPQRVRLGYAGFLNVGSRYWTFRTAEVRKYLSFEVHA